MKNLFQPNPGNTWSCWTKSGVLNKMPPAVCPSSSHLPWACGGIGQADGVLSADISRLLVVQVSLDVMAGHTGSSFSLAGDHEPTRVTTFVLLATRGRAPVVTSHRVTFLARPGGCPMGHVAHGKEEKTVGRMKTSCIFSIEVLVK